MTAPTRHPSEAALADYAMGALRQAFGVVVAAHLEQCAHCRATLRGFEALGGQMLGQLEGSALSDEALDRVMAGLDRPLPAPPPAAAKPTGERVAFGKELWLGPGMGLRKAAIEGGDLLYRLRLPAGLQIIPHSHRGKEFTTVLKGAFDDGSGVLEAGDFADADGDVDHRPYVTGDGECICLIASEKPMRVKTLAGKVVHMLTGL
ncbi:MAG: hypothetical protein EON94_01065 [Caulobacteraceae bacterium]|nr:MAG: hypothetical protein EON94_01065 [Caulobacteraceae bacterium]